MALANVARWVPRLMTTRLLSTAPKNILIAGAYGQIGAELVPLLRKESAGGIVIASDVAEIPPFIAEDWKEDIPGTFIPDQKLDVTDISAIEDLVVKHKIDWIIHNASILSAKGEKDPFLALKVNGGGTENMFHVALKHNLRILAPSTIAVFGPTSPKDGTPDHTIMEPTTMYGLTKVHLELLGEYYRRTKGLDFRSLRYPGILSWKAAPGGGTTDYAIEMCIAAVNEKAEDRKYASFLAPDAKLPMMTMEDCLKATMGLLTASKESLTQGTYNVAAVSFTPEGLYHEIKKHVPDFKVTYAPDFRQGIAETWPRSCDDSIAQRDWNWQPSYGMERMVKEMLENLAKKNGVPFPPQ